MPPRKKIVKKAVKAVRKTPTNTTPTSPVNRSPDSTSRDVNSITTGDDGQSDAPAESPVAEISAAVAEAITAGDDKPEIDAPSVDSSKESPPAISDARVTGQEEPDDRGTSMAVDSSETLAPEKSPTVLSHAHSSTDVSLGVAAGESLVGEVTTEEAASGAKQSDSKPGIPPRKKIVKKIVKIVRKVPAKKTPATETPGDSQTTVPEENAAQNPSKDSDSEAIRANGDTPETEIPALDSSREALHDVAAAGLEAPAVDITPMVMDTDETPVSVKSPSVLSQEPSSTDATFSEAAVNTQAGDISTPLAASESKSDSKPAGKGKKIVVKKVKKVVKSGKSPAPGRSSDAVPMKAQVADETLMDAEVCEPTVASETPAPSSQDPLPRNGVSVDAAVSETLADSLITPSAASESEPSTKPSGTGKKVVVRKVKKVVKRVVKVVKKVGEVKRVEEKGDTEKGGEHPHSSSADLAPEAEQGEDVDGSNERDINGKTKEENVLSGNSVSGGIDAAMSLRRQRKKSEVFVGGLDRDAKEDDVRKVFGKAGEIVEVRIMMDGKTGKNKGYAFVRYATVAQAKRAVSDFAKVEVCGKVCGAAAVEGDDRIFLGNIDKKWKREDIMRLLKQTGIEKIDALTLLSDPNNATLNRGFAFLEFETNRDAQIAYKKLQKKNAFGKDMNVKVAWAAPLNEPDEEDMQKVKSVFVEGIPSSWTDKNLKQYFGKYGEIERIVLACNMPSAKRKDFAFVNYTTREAAMSCIDSFTTEELVENGLKIDIKVSLAKPVPKGKKTKGDTKTASQGTSKETTNAFQRKTKSNVDIGKGLQPKGNQGNVSGANPSTTVELLHVLREQASWKHGQIVHVGDASSVPVYSYATAGIKRQSSAMESVPYSDPRSYPRPRLEGASYPFANTSVVPSSVMSTSLPYYQRPNAAYGPGGVYGGSDAPKNIQSNYNSVPYGNHLRY